MNNTLDQINRSLLDKCVLQRDAILKPRVGDYVSFSTGQLERFSHDWDDGLQTSPSGSYFLCNNGEVEFSGGLNPVTPLDELQLTTKSLEGEFWIFHHGIAGAGRAVHFTTACRVYVTTAPYKGFLGSDFQSEKMLQRKSEFANWLSEQVASIKL